MKKYRMLSLLTILCVSLLIACTNTLEISVAVDDVTLRVGDTFEIIHTGNVSDVSYASTDQSVATVDDTGIITAVSEGNTVIRISASSETDVYAEVDVTVLTAISIELSASDILWVDHEITISVDISEGQYALTSSDESVATVTQQGVVRGIKAGSVVITATSAIDSSVSASLDVMVYDTVDTLVISGKTVVSVYENTLLTVEVAPNQAVPHVLWSVSDEQIATINQEGILIYHQAGTLIVTATSITNDEVVATHEMVIFNQMLIHIEEPETAEYENWSYQLNVDLFNNIQDALNASKPGVVIYILSGEFEQDLEILQSTTLHAVESVSFEGHIKLSANDINIKGINFKGKSSIYNQEAISNIEISHNQFELLDESVSHAISLINVSNLLIAENRFNQFDGHAILVHNYYEGFITIYKNIISNLSHAITITIDEAYDDVVHISVERNDISDVDLGIKIDTLNEKTYAYARFNAVSNVSGFSASSTPVSNVEFTLNYWGSESLDFDNFEHISAYMLMGHYETKQSIISEAQYDPEIPVKIYFVNPVEEVYVNQRVDLNWAFLPHSFETTRIRFITSDSNILMVSQMGILEPRTSGLATITLRSSVRTSVNVDLEISVITDPGIDLVPSVMMQGLTVGDTFTLEAKPFPYTIASEDVVFRSSDENIATIDASGHVTSHGSGEVILYANLVNDMQIEGAFYVTFYDSIDNDNLLDILTQYQVLFSQMHTWQSFGTGFNFSLTAYDSVSYYYFDQFAADDSQMVPISTGIRPGIKKPAHPAGIPTYNPSNVYWIVVHDTANTNTGAGALSHSNYLLNAANAGTILNTSWHYTIDDAVLMQHIPEDEIAYHAGDGSTLPGTHATYLGGGNRNGIGIEMAVGQGYDQYRIWQRTAKLVGGLLAKYNLPRTQMKYHRDFSGKICPNTLINSGLIGTYESFVDIEYLISTQYADAQIEFVSHNTDYLDNNGRIISMPFENMHVSYTISITHEGQTNARTFTVNLPGTVR